MRPFGSLLVANRGEIACRIFRTARAEGLRTVAVVSEADRGAPHAALADAAVDIGPAAPGESYLDADRILAAARDAAAEAIHPGYGFLSENADFARAVIEAGLVWVGPPPEALALMGDKAAARALAEAEGVPVLPGLNDPGADHAALIAAAPGIGFPLMVKARAGGGGRGMRRVDAAQALPEALRLARGEAATAFGDDALILERALDGARHVEVQVLADAHGAVLTLGERDCSAQRRRQKVLEEAPAPGLSQTTRAALAEAARRLTRAGGYVNAGTAEFLVSPGGEAFFLEMNARLQVEHPVTEAVTGLDLVALQLRVAAGRPLGLSQEDVRLHGHAVEARLCAEDPAAGFLPSAGPILGWRMPTGEGLRVDAGYAEGAEVPAVYDSLLAKVVAWGETREIALARLTAALARTAVLGPRSNAAFLREAAGHRDFAAGGVATTWLEAALPAPVDAPASEAEAAMAAALVLEAAAASAAAAGGLRAELRGWSS
ncbi:MAG: biotin carboxylase N-terminal domain-containing protein, partial [Pseudomonadota bacterium]